MEQYESTKTKVLVAFDFDHTILDGDSDIHIMTLCPTGGVPQDLKDLYTDKCWARYMGEIFKHLFQNGVTKNDIKENIEGLPLTKGMIDLIKYLNKENYDVIIISDSNSRFIEFSLEHAQLDHIVSNVYTNPAKFDDKGCLQIEYYHNQDWCDLSPENLCKGHILEDHLKKNSGRVSYEKIIYIGDGANDLCPVLKLSKDDYVCVRRDFPLWEKLKENGCFEGKENDLNVKARILVWSFGIEILDLIKNI